MPSGRTFHWYSPSGVENVLLVWIWGVRQVVISLGEIEGGEYFDSHHGLLLFFDAVHGVGVIHYDLVDHAEVDTDPQRPIGFGYTDNGGQIWTDAFFDEVRALYLGGLFLDGGDGGERAAWNVTRVGPAGL